MAQVIENVAVPLVISPTKAKMLRNCRQVSFEALDTGKTESVFSFDVPIPDVPSKGAIVQVICAGVCYRRRTSSGGDPNTPPHSPISRGIRDGSLFPGYEVAGIIDQIGCDVPQDFGLYVGMRVVVYPYKGLPSVDKGYADYISVPDANCLVPVPDSVPMQVAAMLPSGALWAAGAVRAVMDVMDASVASRGRCNVLVVGTGGLALWIIRVAKHYLADRVDQVRVTVAALKDDALGITEELEKWNVISWSEDVYENHLVERTMGVCDGPVDVVLDFGATPRSLSRSIKCLRENGEILVGQESFESLAKKFQVTLSESRINLREIHTGTLDQLKELVDLVAEGKIVAPPCNVFSVDDASDVLEKLSQSTIRGRAVLRFNNRSM